MSGKTQKIDMCHGPLLSGIIAFSLPLMLSGCLQLLFNAADDIVLGFHPRTSSFLQFSHKWHAAKCPFPTSVIIGCCT